MDPIPVQYIFPVSYDSVTIIPNSGSFLYPIKFNFKLKPDNQKYRQTL